MIVIICKDNVLAHGIVAIAIRIHGDENDHYLPVKVLIMMVRALRVRERLQNRKHFTVTNKRRFELVHQICREFGAVAMIEFYHEFTPRRFSPGIYYRTVNGGEIIS